MDEKERWYQEHVDNETYPDGHPDGCFYCGSHTHMSDGCNDYYAVMSYWEEDW